MIPALLSCVFVLYLYRTLNSPGAGELAGDDSRSATNVAGLESRLDALESRIERLSKARGGMVEK